MLPYHELTSSPASGDFRIFSDSLDPDLTERTLHLIRIQCGFATQLFNQIRCKSEHSETLRQTIISQATIFPATKPNLPFMQGSHVSNYFFTEKLQTFYSIDL